ncbi:hypothetical protein [Xenorhabdus bovienii]|nr:hypothetical protein [Xenorhabdus bovienii]
MSKLTQLDPLSEESYRLDHFIPATETTKFSYTSGRVALPVYTQLT